MQPKICCFSIQVFFRDCLPQTKKYLLTTMAQLISVNDSYATDTRHKMFDFCFVLYLFRYFVAKNKYLMK